MPFHESSLILKQESNQMFSPKVNKQTELSNKQIEAKIEFGRSKSPRLFSSFDRLFPLEALRLFRVAKHISMGYG